MAEPKYVGVNIEPMPDGYLLQKQGNGIIGVDPDLIGSDTATNIGASGEGLFKEKIGAELRFKRLKGGTNITLTPTDTDEVLITGAAVGEVNTALNVGEEGEGIFKEKSGPELRFKRIKGGSGITVAPAGSDEILISGAGGGGGETITAVNIGSDGEDVFKEKVGDELRFKKIKGSGGIEVSTTGSDEILITGTGGGGEGEITTVENIGVSGEGVFKEKVGDELRFKKLKGGTGITISPTGLDEIEISMLASGSTSYVLIRDEKASGTNGGTFTNGAWRTRDLNTKVIDTANIAALASNRITLPVGTYRVRATGPVYNVDRNQLRIQDVVANTTLFLGVSCYGSYGGEATLYGRFTLTTSSQIELQHRCASTISGNGLGTSGGWGTEIYATIELVKESDGETSGSTLELRRAWLFN